VGRSFKLKLKFGKNDLTTFELTWVYILINHLGPLYTMVKDCTHGVVEGIQNTSKGCPWKFRNHLFVGPVCEL
jgi:hypothetical protein